MSEAEMVFTTLSSTGRRIFQRCDAPFATVLIDEAAQASEIAALQPLAFGCRRCAAFTVLCCLSSWYMLNYRSSVSWPHQRLLQEHDSRAVLRLEWHLRCAVSMAVWS